MIISLNNPYGESIIRGKRSPLPLLLLSVALIALTLSAGCDYVPDNDIVVVKLTSNGTLEWSKVIDSDRYDLADSILPTSDGGFVLSARLFDPARYKRYPFLVKLSPDGEIWWNLSVTTPNCGNINPMENYRRELITFSESYVCWFSPEGHLIANRSYTPMILTRGINTRDGGNLFTGFLSERRLMTHEEFITDQFRAGYSENDWNDMCIIRNPPDSLCNESFEKAIAIKTDADGNELWRYNESAWYYSSRIESVSEHEKTGNYSLTLSENEGRITYQSKTLQLSDNGNLVITPPFEQPFQRNQTRSVIGNNNISAGIQTSSADLTDSILSRGTPGNLVVLKYQPNGSIAWKKNVPAVVVTKVKSVVPAPDGGYVILCENDKS